MGRRQGQHISDSIHFCLSVVTAIPYETKMFNCDLNLDSNDRFYSLAFMKKLVEKLDPERAACVKSKMPEVIKKIMGRFKEYEFFTGESMDPEGLVVLLDYREDGRTPFLIVFKDAVVEEKFVSHMSYSRWSNV